MELTREVKCAVCQEQMFYDGDTRAESEILMEVSLPKWQKPEIVHGLNSIFSREKFYAHLRCWNSTIGPILHKSVKSF